MKHTVTFETTIACSVEALFDFHADTKNLTLITPANISVNILKLETPLQEDNEAVLHIKRGFFAFTWELAFEKVQSPKLIVDVATRSPFKVFRHEHHFVELNGTHSILRDVLRFTLPFEPLSSLVVWFVKKDMQKMLAYRHAETVKHLSAS